MNDTEAVTPELTLKMKQLRARNYLKQTPDLIAHILMQVRPSIGGGQGVRVDGGEKHPIPINARALEDANNTYAQLVNWSISHARSLYVPPPSSVLGWWSRDEDCDGLPSWTNNNPLSAALLVRSVTDWLQQYSGRIEGLLVADAYFDDVRTIVAPLFGRYPRAPRKPIFAARDCPACGKHSVIVDFDDRRYDAETDHEETIVTVACTVCSYVIPTFGLEDFLAVR